MAVETFGKLKVITIERFKEVSNGRVRHAFCTRLGGVSQGPYRSLNFDPSGGDSRDNIAQNKQILCSAIGLQPDQLFLANQVHGDQVLVLKDPSVDATSKYYHLDYDAIVTQQKGIALGVLTADCLPIMAYDPVKHAIGIAHSGWRGTCLNIAGNLIYRLRREFGVDPENVWVALGPCIGECCYEVDIKVVRSIKNSTPRWKEFVKPMRANKYSFDLAGLNIHQLLEAGVQQAKITRINACTACNSKIFFSLRASRGRTGRQLNFIQLLE